MAASLSGLKARVDKLEARRCSSAPVLLWMDEGETVEQARAKAGLSQDDPVIAFRWRSDAEEQQAGGQ